MPRFSVARRSEVADGSMKGVKAGEADVLLVGLEGTVRAFHGHCTHYGAPLAEGVLDGERIICPWHHACFSARNGELLEPPALDALPQFAVSLEGDAVWVELPESVPEARTPDMQKRDAADTRVFAILGAGAAGLAAAETLRQEGFTGRVVLVTGENELPYDRTLLSKEYLAAEKPKGWLPLRDTAFLERHGLELLTGKVAAGLDAAKRELTFGDGSSLTYDALLLAVGSTPERLELPGSELAGIHYLRTLADARNLVAGAKAGSSAVVIGASFIGLECAASLRERGLEVSVVTPDAAPFEALWGREVGEMLVALHSEKGVKFLGERQVAGFAGKKQLSEVQLQDGSVLGADLVVIGAGVTPATSWLDSIAKNDDGSLTVDAYLRVEGQDSLYAAGDIATFPLALTGEGVRIEHWRLAMQHGRTAARNMLEKGVAFGSVPFFWSKLFDLNVRYVGYAQGWDETVVDGALQERKALVYYLKEGQLRAVLGVQRDPDICAAEACMQREHLPSAEELRRGSFDWLDWLRRAGA